LQEFLETVPQRDRETEFSLLFFGVVENKTSWFFHL
jgi:hypothetical protein